MVILFFSNNYKLHYNVIDAEKLLDTHSGDEGVTVDIAAEQRMLEEEDVDETSDASTLTPGKGESMDVDNRHVPTTLFSATGSTMAGSLKESSHTPAADSTLKSQSRGVDGEAAHAEGVSTPSSQGPSKSGASSLGSTKETGESSMPKGAGFNGNMYEAIRKLRNAVAKPRMIGIHVETRMWSAKLGDLSSEGGKWAVSAHYRHLYDARVNISTSFNPHTLWCESCPTKQRILDREGNPSPICIISSDQCFPAYLPASGGGRCCVIIRVEDGTIPEIRTATRNILGSSKLPVGSVISICSASHLARVGTAKYAADLVDALYQIENDYGKSVRAIHGLPIFRTGVEDQVLIRGLLDVMDWLEEVNKRGMAHLARP